MKIKYFFKFSLLVILSLGLWACSGNPAPSSNKPMNAVANNATNTANATAQNINQIRNSLENGDKMSQNSNSNTPIPVNQKTLSDSLKSRLKTNKPTAMSAQDWEKDKWLPREIGAFYNFDNEFVKDVVTDVTNRLLNTNNKRLTAVSHKRLRNGVNAQTKCSDAVSKMLSASIDTEPVTMTP